MRSPSRRARWREWPGWDDVGRPAACDPLGRPPKCETRRSTAVAGVSPQLPWTAGSLIRASPLPASALPPRLHSTFDTLSARDACSGALGARAAGGSTHRLSLSLCLCCRDCGCGRNAGGLWTALRAAGHLENNSSRITRRCSARCVPPSPPRPPSRCLHPLL